MSIEVVLAAFTEHGSPPKGNGPKWSACCPAHDDHNPSLSITENSDGRVLIHCQAGCELSAVLVALELDMLDLAPPNTRRGADNGLWTPRGEALMAYDYADEEGTLLYQVLRLPDKSFMQRRPDPTRPGKWVWRLEDVRLVPYRLKKVLAAIRDGQTCLIVEGEKDCHSLEGIGLTATCNSGGAGKWRAEFGRFFDGADVIVVADKDTPGYRHARSVVENLRDNGATVRLAEAAVGKDVTDHLAAGFTVEELVSLDDADIEPDLAPDLHEFLAVDDEFDWLVPGLIERGDRLMLTGSEGTGKSHFLRQIAVCLAAGINPVGFARIDLLRILLIDCENGARHTRRQLRPLRDIANAAGRPIPVGSLRILMRPSGLDLTGEDDSAWLLERVIAHKPDVLIIGPLYRLHAQNPNEEMPARQTIAALDAARIAASCAVILEAHAGHAQNGKPRDLRPTGSSLWLRWPEFGYGLAATEVDDKDRATKVDLKAWRGPRDEREWPRAFTRGKPSEWPWLSTSRPQPTPLPLPAPAAQRSFSEPLERDQAF